MVSFIDEYCLRYRTKDYLYIGNRVYNRSTSIMLLIYSKLNQRLTRSCAGYISMSRVPLVFQITGVIAFYFLIVDFLQLNKVYINIDENQKKKQESL